MDEKLTELKEKQAQIGDKISLLQKTNQKKDEEAAEIRQLIAECRENLNRIKGIAPGEEYTFPPCSSLDIRGSGAASQEANGGESAGGSTDGTADPSEGRRSKGIRIGEPFSGRRSEASEKRRREPSEGRSGEPSDGQRSEASERRPGEPSEGRSGERSEGRRSEISDKRRGEPSDGRRSEPSDGRRSEPLDGRRSEASEKRRSEASERRRGEPSDGRRSEASEGRRGEPSDGRRSEASDRRGADPSEGKSSEAPEGRRPYGSKSPEDEKKAKPCEDLKKKKGYDKERVSCKVDLSKMKVRIRGPSEDLKKLDATQLINLLEKFQCQELIINTGEEMIQDPGEVRLIYFMHPGNIVMVAGIMMMAFLINTNLCAVVSSLRTKLMLNGLYLSSIALHCGMVLWMSFVRGYALKFGLNQDTFHLVDNVILPKYFSVCVLLSALTLYSFLATHCMTPWSTWPLEVMGQMAVIVMTFFLELLTICYVIPAIIKLRDATDDFEIDDEDPECNVPDSFEKNLVKLGKLMRTLCLTNFLTLLLLGVNMFYITMKLGSTNPN